MAGFESPNYTQTPNDLFDSMLPDMGEAELKVTLCAIRKTFGFHRNSFHLSLTKMQGATGLSRQGVLDGAAQAELRGTLIRIHDNGVTEWVVNVVDRSVYPVDQTSLLSRPPSIKETTKEKDKDNTSADAEVRDRKLSDRQVAIKVLEEKFHILTNLQLPVRETDKDKRASAESWWLPLGRIWEACDKNIVTAEYLIEKVIKKMYGDNLTIGDPRSIQKTALAIRAEQTRVKVIRI